MENQNKSICVIGGGFAGLGTAIQLQKAFPHYDLTLFEKNKDFGGTWLVNTYPGCACDIQSHLFQFSFDKNPYWCTNYASQVEILMYMKRLASKHNLYEKARFSHLVQKLEWLEDSQKWKASVLDTIKNIEESFLFDFVFCNYGEYHLPKTPEIFKKFKGESMHSAEWKSNIELSGKTVAVVGSGASAIQIIPSIVDKVEKLLSYQRTPAWVIARRQFRFPKCVQWAFEKIPGVQALFRKMIYFANEFQYPAFRVDGIISPFARPIGRLLAKSHLEKQVKIPNLRASLLPKYTFGCNRVCLSSEYYPSLARDNVEVITDEVIDVTSDSLVTKNRHDKIDVLILATGFHIHEYFGPLNILGRNGENILESWKATGPSLYLEITSHSMPNLFFIHGPGVDLGHNTGIVTIELQLSWVVQLLQEMERKKFTVFSVKASKEREYVQEHREDMKKTIWSTNDCGTYYANTNGLITIVYPRSQVDYWYRTRRVNLDHFNLS